MAKGKIIAIIGSPRTGKSFLAKRLAKRLNAKLFLEGEEKDIPPRVREAIQKNIRPKERILWFRNLQIKNYLKALDLKQKGKTVIVDSFWISFHPYIELLLKGSEKESVQKLANADIKTLPWPDKVIMLTSNEKGIRNFIKSGGREFDRSEDFISKQAIPLNKLYTKYFQSKRFNVKKIDRSKFDFAKKKDLETVVKLVR